MKRRLDLAGNLLLLLVLAGGVVYSLLDVTGRWPVFLLGIIFSVRIWGFGCVDAWRRGRLEQIAPGPFTTILSAEGHGHEPDGRASCGG